MTIPAHIADMLSRLGRIEGKLDSFSTTVIAQMKVQDDRTTAHARPSQTAAAP